MIINKIKLVWEPMGVRTFMVPSCDILIDGESLSHLASKYSKTRIYGPIEAPINPDRHFLGVRELQYDEIRGKKSVAECSCGYGCGKVIACKIIKEDDVIIWRDFASVVDDDFTAFGSFVFDEVQYFDEVQAFKYYT